MPIQSLDTGVPDSVVAFLASAVPGRDRAHWRWKYRVGATSSPTAFYWQEPDGRVSGFIGLMPTTLHAGRECHAAAWFVDWHVTPGEGRAGVGLGLLRKAEAAAGLLFTLQGSEDTRLILPRLGWKESLAPATWVRPVSRRYMVDWIARHVPAWIRRPAGLAGVLGTPYFRCAEPAPAAAGDLVDVERFPADYDDVWRAHQAECAPAMARDSAYLNYLCADYPDGGYRLQMVRSRGETVGHLVSRVAPDGRGLQRGRIVDVLWPRSLPDLAVWLIRSACWQLQQAGADYVECVASAPRLAEVLRLSRFRSRRPVPLWYHRLPAGAPDPDRWHITFLDCDRAYR